MSNIIDFLERMGQDARLRASRSEMELAMADAQIDPELRAAILAGDQRRLAALLGRGTLCCMQFPAREDDDEDTEESPSRDGEEITSRSALRVLVSVG